MVIRRNVSMNIKKNYIAPSIEVVEVEYESLMTTASGETGNTGVGGGNAGNGPELAKDRRGSWGNLWD